MDWLDSLLLPLYQITGDPVTGFFVGTFLLSSIAAVLGEVTIAVLFLSNRNHYERLNAELAESHNASIDAAKRGDKDAYTFHNRKANAAFGKTFFSQIALSMGSLWPVFFALGFLQGRFADIEFPIPGTGLAINYILIFLFEYVLARLIFNHVKYLIPGVDRLKSALDDARAKAKEMQLLSDTPVAPSTSNKESSTTSDADDSPPERPTDIESR
ncbi:hypothetical protein KQI52_05030 [bacterium]|nr:hypothetical protein [bacterium]